MTYTQAVEKACNGDSTGFEFLYDTTKNNKYYLALKYVKDEEAAKDVLQEAYIRAWKNLDKLKEPEKFDSWLAQIVVNTDQPIDGVGEDTETTDAPEDENGSEKYADIPESVLPSSVRNDKDYFEFWDEPVKATCWIDGVKGTIYADWDKTQIIKEVTYDVDGYEDELLIIGCTLDGGTHAIAIYNGQYVVVNDAMWDHWYNGKSSAFD